LNDVSNDENGSILLKFELARSILPISGQCPLCLVEYKGLRKHFNTCYFKDRKNSNYLNSTVSISTQRGILKHCTTKNTHKITKQCSFCKHNYIFKHTCQKLKSRVNQNSNDGWENFNFTDDYWVESHNFPSSPILQNFPDFREFFDEFGATYSNNFKILHFNINSLFCKFNEINDILNKKIFDIVFIQETKISSNIPDAFFSNIGYNILRRDRPNGGGGGILIFTSKTIPIVETFSDPSI